MSEVSTAPAVERYRPGRWAVLVAFVLVVVSTQLLWLTYAPVTAQAARAMGVGSGAVGDLAAVNPLLFVLFAVPAGRFADRHLRACLVAGAALVAVGAVVRVGAPTTYGVVLVGQLLGSAGQPLALAVSTAVAARWFPAGERAVAITVASAAQLLGVLTAALTGGPVVDAGGLALVARLQAVFAVVAAVAVVVVVVVVPPAAGAATARTSWSWWRDPFILRLGALLFVGIGVFNVVATWLEPLLDATGDGGAAGALIALTTVAGIVGAAVLGPLAARTGRRREQLVAAALAVVVAFGLMTVLPRTPVVVGIVLAIMGFVLLAGLPVALEWAEVQVGAARAGRATSVLLLGGNLGGILLVLVVQPALGAPTLAFGLVAVAGVLGLAAAATLPGRTAATPDV